MKTRNRKDYFLLTAKGMAMGAADVVPGVSGGTIAFITGIYDELLNSLKQLGPAALKILFKDGFAAFWQHINGFFLLSVFGGILISLKTFAALITTALNYYPLLVWGFFSGLIAASVYLLVKVQPKWKATQWIALLIGIGIVVGISIAKPAHVPGDWWMLFLGGFIAICAMILPGISGSFILLLIGLYPIFLNAINQLDIIALASFGAGCISGLLIFSRVLVWLLARFYHTTIAVLIGFLIGSLNVTWPWKQVISSAVNRHGEVIPLQQQNVLPAQFTHLTGLDSQLAGVIICTILGIVLVVGIERIAENLNKHKISD
ncbi:DUF368 domain-containing protein [Catenovulum sp. 2E275]|uniref:DUF368 domain-containing protein n=1 Tax=Catenovulum sp. 2E275 TaxID=2980497 RepID=UPI0021D34A6A|nr:DUF368 domain-containing protein [Catenovulum sp. 2E275]MCU4676912.1 DUF368 domain-containing protein [Catenovulum sp. 2E275]